MTFVSCPPPWTGVAFQVTVISIKRFKDVRTLCQPEARNDRRDKPQTEYKSLEWLTRMVIGRIGTQRATVYTREIGHAQELMHTLKRPERTLAYHLWQIYRLSSAEIKTKQNLSTKNSLCGKTILQLQ